MIKVIEKGYTIKVVSWENDGDNYNTKNMVIDSREIAKAISEMCNTIFKSKNSKIYHGIGNIMSEDYEDAYDVIIPFMNEHPILWNDKPNPTDEELINICMEYNNQLMGSSEWYYSRVMEKCTVTYSSKDIFVEEIIF